MRKVLLLVAMLCGIVGMRAERQNIIFETDMGNDVDDALALDMLYKYNKQGRINLMAVMLNKEGEFPPKYIDLLNTWYGQKRIPIGLSPRSDNSIVGGANYAQIVYEMQDENGKLMPELRGRYCKKQSLMTNNLRLFYIFAAGIYKLRR